MIPEIAAVQVQPEYRLILTYINGENRWFDASPYLERGLLMDRQADREREA